MRMVDRTRTVGPYRYTRTARTVWSEILICSVTSTVTITELHRIHFYYYKVCLEKIYI